MFFKSLLPALLWALFILIVCGIPGDKLPPPDFLAWLKPDKLVHLFIFGMLSYLLIRGFVKQEIVMILKANPKRWAFIVCIVYGTLVEILQEYVFSHRSGDVRDVAADAIGALLGIWCYHLLMKKKLSGNSSS